jgi:hypothetical protein
MTTSQFEHEMRLACRAFFAKVLGIAEHAALDSVGSVFAQMRLQLESGSTALNASPTEERRRSRKVARVDASAPRGGPSLAPMAPTDHPALRERVIESVRQHPGATVVELVPHVSIPEAALRRYLRQLAEEHRIRIDETPSTKFRGQTRHTYFVLEASSGAAGEVLPSAAFA